MIRFPRRVGLLTQLLIGFSAGALLVTLLLVAGDAMLRGTSQHLVQTLENQVRPLVRMHRMESRIAALRNQELALPGLRDVFVVQEHTVRMEREMAALDEEFRDFMRRIESRALADAQGGRAAMVSVEPLSGHWQDYRGRLGALVLRARAMDMDGAAAITASGTHVPYQAMQKILHGFVDVTEQAADSAYRDTVADQQAQRRGLLTLVMLGSLALIAGLAWSGKVVVRRIRVLHEHAQKLASGEQSGRIEISGHDEIGDLAEAFDSMREQVLSRELALREAQSALEARVSARTRDLQTANGRLVLFSQTVAQSPLGILIADIDGRIEFVNDAYTRITGRPAAALVGAALADKVLIGQSINVDEAVRVAKSGVHPWEVEQRSVRADGAEYWERLRLVAIHDEAGVPAHLLLSREDITERHDQQEKIAYQAHYDALTGLPNRVLAHDRLVQTTGRSRRDGGKAVAMYLDLDNFKQINDTLGHTAGDELLRQAALRLKAVIRDEDTVARLGGDEFLIVASGLAQGAEIAALAEKIIAAFAPPFAIEERELVTTPSIGIAVFPDDGTDPMVLLRNADLAMYESKEAGRNTYRFFNQSIHDLSLQRLEIGRCLRGALERSELHVVYHPLVSADSGRIVGSEALLRWNSPELGMMQPEVFIPIAEQNGLIIDIGRWVLREACATLARWRHKQDGFVMAVNVSPRQFRAAGFVDTVRECIKEFSVPPGQLEIEITEGVLLRNQDEVREIITQLHGLGVRLSMDDFGTGYSSLSYLREFPFHTIKIDRSFIRDVSDDQSDRALVVAAVRMAQAMGLQIIAEGVETDEQWSFLADQDCDVLQGFRFGEPVTAHEFGTAWVNANITPPARRGLQERALPEQAVE